MNHQNYVEAWAIRPGDPGKKGPARMDKAQIQLPRLGPHEVLIKPVYGCWEGNMGHAAQREPIDVCRARGEDFVILGNAAAVRVLETGSEVKSLRAGDAAMLFCVGEEDRFGFPKTIFGYDAPRTIGCLAKRTVVREQQLVRLPEHSRYSLAQWAAFSLRYVTAWSNWELAIGVFRLQVGDECKAPWVWGWGGGVTCAELDLAARAGCRVTIVSSRPELVALQTSRVPVLDRRRFEELDYDAQRYEQDKSYRERYRSAEADFIAEVTRMTDGEMVQIFLDYIGEPVHRATVKALSRHGVIASAGWKHGMNLSLLRAKECIDRHQHVHTHYARREQAERAVAYAEANGWMPVVDARIYAFDEIPELVDDYLNGRVGYFPCFAVDPD